MAVIVRYGDFSSDNAKRVKDLMPRDASWGTHTASLAAAESACGTGSGERWRSAEPKLKNLSDRGADDEVFELEFPDGNFDIASEGVDHLIATVAGDILLNRDIKRISVVDINFSPELLAEFPGPNRGVDGVYHDLFTESIGGVDRPLLAYSLKPRVGMNVDDMMKLFSQAAEGGVDLVEDDERLVNPEQCRFRDRVERIAPLQAKSRGTLYSPNITGDAERALERLDIAASNGIRVVKFDVLVAGFEVLRQVATTIRDKHASKIAITVYPDAYGAFRNIGRSTILKLSRLCGADIIYAGSPSWARYESGEGEIQDTLGPVVERHRELCSPINVDSPMRSTLATITNDQHPGYAEAIVVLMRKLYEGHFSYGFFVGGGISGFPDTDVREAASIWRAVLEHSATEDLENYTPFDFGRFENAFQRIGWNRFNLQGVV